ncbi:MAG: glycoside hydrolase family 104 protein [Burkholderiaceae bacterium]|nr:glycoside hydrolase family 104 protein [Burkholderiaceae bacterium]
MNLGIIRTAMLAPDPDDPDAPPKDPWDEQGLAIQQAWLAQQKEASLQNIRDNGLLAALYGNAEPIVSMAPMDWSSCSAPDNGSIPDNAADTEDAGGSEGALIAIGGDNGNSFRGNEIDDANSPDYVVTEQPDYSNSDPVNDEPNDAQDPAIDEDDAYSPNSSNRAVQATSSANPTSAATTPKQKALLGQVDEAFKDPRVLAFLDTLAQTEGGKYDVRYGGKHFSDFSTHPGSPDGKGSAAGRYQITKETWVEFGRDKLGLNDFSPQTQDRIAVAVLMHLHADTLLRNNDIEGAIHAASQRWNSLPQGRNQTNRYTKHKQPFVPFDKVQQIYNSALVQRQGNAGR